MSIRITTLGTLRVTQADRLLSALPSQRLRCALLVHLAAVRESTRDRLVALFWAEKPEERGRRALSQTVYELRRTLGEDCIIVEGERITAGPHISIDLKAFEEAVENGNYQAALGLYRGPFLDAFYVSGARGFDDWLENQRARAERLHRRARREVITAHIGNARMREALIAAREWVAIDPSEDEAQHQLIQLLAGSGDRAGAIRQYESYERLLSRDDLAPLDETRELAAEIRGGSIGSLPIAPGAGIALPSAAASPATSAAVERRAADATPAVRRGFTPRRYALAAAVLALIVVVGAAATQLRRAPAPATIAQPPAHQLAVLYLDDLSPPPGTQHLAAALTETLIEQFSNLQPLLAVRSSQAVARFRGRSIELDSIARALAVDMLVTGDVAAANGRVRIRVRLVEPVAGTVIASRVVEGAEGEYFELLDRVVDDAGQMLRQRLGTHLDWQRRRAGTHSEAAWLNLQLAGEMRRTFLRVGAADIRAGRAAFARADSVLASAESLDPRWTEPIIERGWLAERRAALEVAIGAEPQGREWLDSAVHHADRALALEPQNTAALELRGTARFLAYTFVLNTDEDALELLARAETDLITATRLDPGRARAFATLASAFFGQGRYAEANAAARQAVQLDAFLKQTETNIYFIGMSQFELGYDADAARTCGDGMRRYGGAPFAYCLLTIMAWSESEPALPDSAWQIAGAVPYTTREGHATTRPMLDMLVAATLARAGVVDSASAVLTRAAAMATASAATGWIAPVVLARLGDTDRAARMLQDHFDRTAGLDLGTRRSRALQPLLREPLFARPAPQPPAR